MEGVSPSHGNFKMSSPGRKATAAATKRRRTKNAEDGSNDSDDSSDDDDVCLIGALVVPPVSLHAVSKAKQVEKRRAKEATKRASKNVQ